MSAADTHGATIDWGDGTFTVTVTVTDDDGDAGAGTLTVEIDNVEPEVDAGPDKAGFVGQEISFDGSFSDPGGDDTHTFAWDFGDGETSSDLVTTHTYIEIGEFEATLTVTDDDGDSDDDSLQVVILVEAVVTAGVEVSDLELSDDNPKGGEPVTARFVVTNTSNDTIEATVELLVNGELHDQFDVELLPGTSKNGESDFFRVVRPVIRAPAFPTSPPSTRLPLPSGTPGAEGSPLSPEGASHLVQAPSG